MKKLSQISKEINQPIDIIRHYIVGNNLPCEKHNNKVWIDSTTENKLNYLLHITGKLEYIILESRINKKK